MGRLYLPLVVGREVFGQIGQNLVKQCYTCVLRCTHDMNIKVCSLCALMALDVD